MDNFSSVFELIAGVTSLTDFRKVLDHWCCN